MDINPLVIHGTLEKAKRILRQAMLQEYNGSCPLCGNELQPNANIHHKDGCGLNWEESNLIMLCHQCHRKLTNPRRNTKGIKYKKG